MKEKYYYIIAFVISVFLHVLLIAMAAMAMPATVDTLPEYAQITIVDNGSAFSPDQPGPAAKKPVKPSSVRGVKVVKAARPTANGEELIGPVTNRKVIYREFPQYPEWARKRGINASVDLKFWIDAQGNVKDVIVARSSDYVDFDTLATIAMRNWRFDPGPSGDQWGKVRMEFRVE